MEEYKKVFFEEMGTTLYAKRKELGISLEKVMFELKLTQDSIEAMEKGDIERLPDDVYAKGFYRSYSKLLGLDKDIVDAFINTAFIEVGVEDKSIPALNIPMKITTENKSNFFGDIPANRKNIFLQYKKTILLIIVLIILFFLISLFFTSSEKDEEVVVVPEEVVVEETIEKVEPYDTNLNSNENAETASALIKKTADKKAAEKKLADKKAADKKAADKKAAEKKAAEKKAAEKKVADKKLADKKAADKKLADKKAADKKLADKKAADKKLADKKAADKKAADKKAAEKAIETPEEGTVVDKKATEQAIETPKEGTAVDKKATEQAIVVPVKDTVAEKTEDFSNLPTESIDFFAKNTIWLELKYQNKTTSFILNPNETRMVSFKGPMEIIVGDSSAVDITFNDALIPLSNIKGKVQIITVNKNE